MVSLAPTRRNPDREIDARDVEALLAEVERLRGLIYRRDAKMEPRIRSLIRRADQLLRDSEGGPFERPIASGRTLLHCLHSGLRKAA